MVSPQEYIEIVNAMTARLPIKVQLTYDRDDRLVTFDGLYADSPGNGAGTAALYIIAMEADKAEVDLELWVQCKDDDENTDQDRLIKFYRRFGFQRETLHDTPEGRAYMRRKFREVQDFMGYALQGALERHEYEGTAEVTREPNGFITGITLTEKGWKMAELLKAEPQGTS